MLSVRIHIYQVPLLNAVHFCAAVTLLKTQCVCVTTCVCVYMYFWAYAHIHVLCDLNRTLLRHSHAVETKCICEYS